MVGNSLLQRRLASSDREQVRQRRGFSLTEVLISTFVVSIGILGTSSAVYYGVRAQKETGRRTLAAYWGREMISLIRARNLPFQPGLPAVGSALNDGNYDSQADDSGPRRAFNAAPFANDFPNVNFQRRIEMKMLSTDPANYLSQVAAIKLTLFWNEGGSAKSLTMWSYHRKP